VSSRFLLSSAMGHDIGLHNPVTGIVRFGESVRVRCNISPEILNPGPLTIDHFLVIIDKCVAFPMRSTPQLATGICWRFEATEKAIGLRVRIPPYGERTIPSSCRSGPRRSDTTFPTRRSISSTRATSPLRPMLRRSRQRSATSSRTESITRRKS
jgi:hypothetical protein